MKALLVIILAVILSTCVSLTYRYHKDSEKSVKNLNDERYSRMIAEEDLKNAQTEIKTIKADLERTQIKLKSLDASLEQQKMVNGDLKSRLTKAAELRTEMEKKINELQALAVKQQELSQESDVMIER